MHLAVLLPQQRERDGRLLQFLVQHGPVRDHPVCSRLRSGKQARLERRFIEFLGQRPGATGRPRALQVLGHGAQADAARLRNGAQRESGFIFQAKYVA